VEPPTSLRECLAGFRTDPNRGIRVVMQSAHETSVRALCKRPKGPFHIVALGDSVMWGQGLNWDKFARRVQQELGGALAGPRMVQEPYIFAHSGATLKPLETTHEWKEALRPPQELPLSYPSIPRQLEMAESWLSEMQIGHDQVGLVLLNGGLNDVGVFNVLSPSPSVTSDSLRRLTQEKMNNMRDFLPVVLERFPKAKVVIPNYFQIISTDTDLNALNVLLLFFFAAAIPVTAILRNKLDKQTEAFNGTWMEEMNSIIEEIHSTTPDKAERICLVDVQFSDRNAYGAPDSYLWDIAQVGFDFVTRDQVEDARIRECADAENHPWGEDVEWYCDEAAAFHPNVAGANRYRDAIMSGITSKGWIEEWRGGPWTWVLEEMTASMDPPLGTPEERLTQWTGKISARELQSPHLPVHGTIDISRDGRVVKRVPTDAEFSWTFARTIIINRERWIQDDRVTVQAPYAKPFVLLSGVKSAYPL
jgi:hypothetical protein